MQERINIIKDFQATIPAQHVNIDLSLITDWDQLLANLQQALDDTEKKLKIMNAQLNKTQSQISSVKNIKTQQQINNGNRFTSSLNTPTITEEQKLKIAADYLRNGISFVKLDEKYFSIDNRHGNKCWGILDNLGIRKNQKGLLKNSNIDTEISKSSGVLKETLIKIKAKGL